MEQVYCVFAGEQYDSEHLVSLHSSLDGAKESAALYAQEHGREDGVSYSVSPDVMSWKSRSGHFISVRPQPVRR